MASAADVIRRSLKLLGVLAAGESLPSEDLADGLIELNVLLGTWANQRLLVHGVRRSTQTLVPQLSPHTIGIGGTFSVARPLRIDAAGVIASGTNVETPIQLLTDTEYRAITDKTVEGALPSRLWVEQTHPTAKLWLWPVPSSAASLVLYAWSRITEFASSDTVSLPDGYENAMAHALALQMAPLFGVEPSGMLMQNAAESLASIKRTNMRPSLLRCDAAVLGGGSGVATLVSGGSGSDSGGLY